MENESLGKWIFAIIKWIVRIDLAALAISILLNFVVGWAIHITMAVAGLLFILIAVLGGTPREHTGRSARPLPGSADDEAIRFHTNIVAFFAGMLALILAVLIHALPAYFR